MDRFKRGSRKNQESFSDYTLLFIVLFLLAFGLVMLYSTSAYDANLTYNDSTYLFRKQIFSTLAGLVVLFIVSHLPYHIWERFAVIGYGVSVALVLLIIPFGIEANGAKRWLRVFGISLQPAEVAKLAMILFLAYLICKMGRNIRTMKGFLVVLGAAAPISGLIYVITRNLSSAIIIMGIAVVMLFVACPDYKRFIILGLIGIAGVAGIVFLIVTICSNLFASQQKEHLVNRNEAIVMNPSVTVRSTPSESGTSLFILHEGRKVNVKDNSMKEWKEIRLEDGKVGWVPASAIEVI